MHVTDSPHPALTLQLITNLVSEVTICSLNCEVTLARNTAVRLNVNFSQNRLGRQFAKTMKFWRDMASKYKEIG